VSRSSARKLRRRQAAQLERSGADLTKLLPAPPQPSWCHWWNRDKSKWYRHDPRIEQLTRLLMTSADHPDVVAISAEIERVAGERLVNLEPEH
jgi:hypothetical protein